MVCKKSAWVAVVRGNLWYLGAQRVGPSTRYGPEGARGGTAACVPLRPVARHLRGRDAGGVKGLRVRVEG